MMRPLPLRRYITVMQQRGFAPREVLAGSGIEPSALLDPHLLIDLAAYRRVVENVVRLAGDDGIGMDMGMARELRDYGILGHAAMVCPTVRYSMEEFWGRYGDALGMMAKLSMPKGQSDMVTIDINAVRMSAPTYRFFVEEALCIILNVGKQVSGSAPHFHSLQFSYAAPHYRKRYATLFGCEIRFGASKTRAALSRRWLEQPLETADAELLRLYRPHLEQLKWEIETSSPMRTRLRSYLLRLGGVIPTLADAARELGMSPRSFRRKLLQEGSSFRRSVEEFRLELAIECLKSEQASTKQVSERVGFDDVNAFRRAFRKWTGCTVVEYRTKLRPQTLSQNRRTPPSTAG